MAPSPCPYDSTKGLAWYVLLDCQGIGVVPKVVHFGRNCLSLLEEDVPKICRQIEQRMITSDPNHDSAYIKHGALLRQR